MLLKRVRSFAVIKEMLYETEQHLQCFHCS